MPFSRIGGDVERTHCDREAEKRTETEGAEWLSMMRLSASVSLFLGFSVSLRGT